MDYGYGIAIDSNGNAYVTGKTSSADFPMSNAIYGSLNGGHYSDAFVTKIATGCKPKKMTTVKDPNPLVQGESGIITVTLKGKKGCKPYGYTVTSKVIAGKKKLTIFPENVVVDSNCVAVFTMTAAADKEGVATVRFETKNLTKHVSVKIKKK